MVLIRCLPTILLLLLTTSLPSSSSATNTLRSGDTLTNNDTLVSASGIFEFGFFAATNSTGRFFLGIWYHNITPQVVVWVANRNTPFANSSGQIKLTDDGNLVVLEAGWKSSWSTSLAPVYGSNLTATLRDDGNLVIQSDSGAGAARWRSFDDPTDTLLPGMKISVDRATGNGTRFTSWKTAADPASGDYTLGLDRRGTRQLVMLNKAERTRWRSGLWIANGFNGVNRMRPLYEYGFHLSTDSEQTTKVNLYFTYMNSTKMRFVLLPNGTETTYVYENGQWKNIWQQPITDCELYNYCGENAVCSESAEPKCSCLIGFEPRSASEWGSGNWTRGCARRTLLKGQRNDSSGGLDDGFRVMEWMKFPDGSEWDSIATDERGCAANCATNDSCTAYAYSSTEGCFRWTGELLDMFRFEDQSNGGELFFRLAGSDLDENNGNKVKPALIIVPAAVGAVLLLICIFFLLWKCKSRIKGMGMKSQRVNIAVTEAGTSGEQYEHTMNVSEIDEFHSERKPFELPIFSFEIIEAATQNFDEENELGKGGFGHVYKGKLPWGEEIAVKRLSRESGQGQEEFKNEMTLIAKLQHVNLVRLLGCCIQGEEKMLIYEYMPNKSLDAFIFDLEKQPLLDWKARFNIIERVARGLLYLHRDSRLRIIHRDLKASNILLDHDMNPKISDFGMARIFGSNQNHDSTNRVVGTFGYMSPEYAMEGLFSVKSDVYSFGVLLLEIVTGKKNTRCRSEEYQNLLGFAWHMWDVGRGMELVDPSMSESCSHDEVLRCIHVALMCVQDRVNDRPTMSSVVIMLGTETKIVARPRRPTFANLAGSPSRTANDCYSKNDMTITVLDDGR